jgi:hypothetical protein
MRYVLLLIFAAMALGCGSTDSGAVQATPDDYQILTEGEPEAPGGSDRFLGNLRDSWGEHVRDCQAGIEFTGRSIARNTERGWDRIVWIFQ